MAHILSLVHKSEKAVSLLQMSSPSSSDDGLDWTSQGASALGFPPENHLTKLFRFCTLLREAIFSYPFGTTKDEYHDFLKSLYLEWSV